MPRSKKRKPASEMTTNEAVDALFHPDMGEALRDEIADRDDEETEEISTDEDPK